jgi:hypothetical protein
MILRLTTWHENARRALECPSADGLDAALEQPRCEGQPRTRRKAPPRGRGREGEWKAASSRRTPRCLRHDHFQGSRSCPSAGGHPETMKIAAGAVVGPRRRLGPGAMRRIAPTICQGAIFKAVQDSSSSRGGGTPRNDTQTRVITRTAEGRGLKTRGGQFEYSPGTGH